MPPEIIQVEQNSPEWFAARRGIATASKFKDILAKGEGKTRRSYMLKLAGERITGEGASSYSNEAMERGHEMEPAARAKYAFTQGVEPQIVGFVRNGDNGASPDALMGADGVLELKSAEPHILIDLMLKGEFPSVHKAQCQGHLWICEREWVDLAIYWPKLPLFTVRAYRDGGYIKQLAEAVSAFNAELEEVVQRVRSYTGDNHAETKAMFERSLANV